MLANAEAVINATVTFGPNNSVKLLKLVTDAATSVRPAHAAKLTYV
jgi:hypothetical protein